jgi:endoglucanase
MKTLERLEQLSNAFGPPAHEEEVRELIRTPLEGLVDRVEVDTLGNLIGYRDAGSDKTLMLDAHMDEVGFMVSHIDGDGFLRLTGLGGWDARILPSHAIEVRTRAGTRVPGVIGSKPPHILTSDERKKAHDLDDLFVDIGVSSREEAHELGVRVGDPAVISYPFRSTDRDIAFGKAFDDRAGCAIALTVLDAVQGSEIPWNLAVNFATSEEVGLRGAKTAAFHIAPTWALALETTVAADVPGVSEAKQPTRLGAGPAITVADKSAIVPPVMVRALETLAEQQELPYQLKAPAYGGTNAGAISLSRGGVAAAVLNVPCRYIHAPVSLLKPSELEQTARLARAFVLEGRGLLTRA